MSLKGTEHMNFHATDPELGPALVSIKDVETEAGQARTHVTLRLSIGTFQDYISPEEASEPENIALAAKRMCPNLTVDCFLPIISRRASNVIADFDKKTSLEAKQYKIGVLCQRRNQFTEEEIFGNNDMSPEFENFLSHLGDKITLRGHEGFSGGLDTKHDQTGTHSIYRHFQGMEVMFHVAQLLPFR